jgi:hypothetical protein
VRHTHHRTHTTANPVAGRCLTRCAFGSVGGSVARRRVDRTVDRCRSEPFGCASRSALYVHSVGGPSASNLQQSCRTPPGGLSSSRPADRRSISRSLLNTGRESVAVTALIRSA